MTDQSDKLAEMAKRHADLILRAAGSRLAHYETRSRDAVLGAVLDCIEEAYREGATFGVETARAASKGETA